MNMYLYTNTDMNMYLYTGTNMVFVYTVYYTGTKTDTITDLYNMLADAFPHFNTNYFASII